MNYYVKLINEAVEFIETRIHERLTLSILSNRFGISDFHFNRMFKTVSGITLKQYILGRKLTKAGEILMETNHSVIDIAFELGFEYPEVFSRAFKKQFGISPAGYRINSQNTLGIPKITIAERDIVNYKGVLTLKGRYLYQEEFTLSGILTKVDMVEESQVEQLRLVNDDFIRKSSGRSFLCQDEFYTVVNCNGEDNGIYSVFCGRKPVKEDASETYCKRSIPGGWYVEFKYYGDIIKLRDTFEDDLYRWIMVTESELNPNGIGMINIYDKDFPDNNNISILIPVKRVINQQDMS